MSEHVYTFNLSIGYVGADREETFDLVDDLGYDADALADRATLNGVLQQELEDWQWKHVESWTEKEDE